MGDWTGEGVFGPRERGLMVLEMHGWDAAGCKNDQNNPGKRRS